MSYRVSTPQPSFAIPLGAFAPDAKADLAAFLRWLAERDPPVTIVKKPEVWHQKAIDAALKVLTFGKMDKFLTEYVTTIGHAIYVPDDWDELAASSKLITLRHEAVHVAQFEKLGGPLMSLVYLTAPLPMGLAWFRAKLEWEGYAESLRTIAKYRGVEAARSQRDFMIGQFTGPAYGWMWPFPGQVGKWFDDEMATIESNVRGAQGATRS